MRDVRCARDSPAERFATPLLPTGPPPTPSPCPPPRSGAVPAREDQSLPVTGSPRSVRVWDPGAAPVRPSCLSLPSGPDTADGGADGRGRRQRPTRHRPTTGIRKPSTVGPPPLHALIKIPAAAGGQVH